MRLRIGDVGLGQRWTCLQPVRDGSEKPGGKHDVVQAKFVVRLCFKSANLQLIEPLAAEPADYRLESEAGRFHDRVVPRAGSRSEIQGYQTSAPRLARFSSVSYRAGQVPVLTAGSLMSRVSVEEANPQRSSKLPPVV